MANLLLYIGHIVLTPCMCKVLSDVVIVIIVIVVCTKSVDLRCVAIASS